MRKYISVPKILALLSVVICALMLAVSVSAAGNYSYLMEMQYDNIVMGKKYIYFSKNGRWGKADLNGTVMTGLDYLSYDDIVSGSTEEKHALYVPFQGEDGKYGYKNAAGEVVVDAVYDYVTDEFRSGAAIVKKYDKYGIINTEGEVLVDFKYELIVPGTEGERYAYRQNGRYGFIDSDFSIMCAAVLRADSVDLYEDYVIYTAAGGKLGFVGYDGQILCSAVWDYVRGFSEGYAAVGVNEDFYGINVRWGYIDKKGDVVIPCIYDSYSNEALDFSEGLAGVCEGEYGYFINKKGEKVIEFDSNIYPYCGFSDGIAVIDDSLDKKYVDEHGRILMSSDDERWFVAEKMVGSTAVVGTISGDGQTMRYGVIRYNGNTPSPWAVNEVSEAIREGIIPQSMQSFYQSSMTRADYCALAVSLIEAYNGCDISEICGRSPKNTFTDTADDAVLYCHALGIILGRGEGIFDPDSTINRQEAARILVNTYSACTYLPDHTAPAPVYNDRDIIDSWAEQGVWYTADWGVMIGVGDNRFDPRSGYTREQAVLTMIRMYKVLSKSHPICLNIYPNISAEKDGETVRYAPCLDCMFYIELPDGWGYDESGYLIENSVIRAKLSDAVFTDTKDEETALQPGEYRFTSGGTAITLTFFDPEYVNAERIAGSVIYVCGEAPKMSDSAYAYLYYYYMMGCEALSWFEPSAILARNSVDVIKYETVNPFYDGELPNGAVAVIDRKITDIVALKNYLDTIFENTISDELMGRGLYADVDGKLCRKDMEWQEKESSEMVSWSVERRSDSYRFIAAYNYYDRFSGEIINTAEYTWICEMINDRWVWTSVGY